MVDDVDDRLRDGEPIRSALSGLFIEELPVDGASISVVGMTGIHSVVSSSGAAAAVVERLQYGLGEGPHWDALATGLPVLLGDVGSPDVRQWPAFASEVAALNVGAMFSFPMTLGTAVVGVVDLCRYRPGDLSPSEVRDAVALTRRVTRSAVHVATETAGSDTAGSDTAGRDIADSDAADLNALGALPEMRREVHQATGMLAAQLGPSATTSDAFAALRAYAFTHDRPMEDVASDIVRRRLDLTFPAP